MRQLKGHDGAVTSVAFSPDGRHALTGGADGTVRLWDVGTGRELQRFIGHTGVVSSVAFSERGRRAVSGGRDRSVRLWNVKTGKQLASLSGHAGWVTSVAFARDGRMVLSGSTDTTARLWDAETRKEVKKFDGHENAVIAVAFLGDRKRIITADKAELWVWDIKTGKKTRHLEPWPSWSVTSLALTPDDHRVLTGHEENVSKETLMAWTVTPWWEFSIGAGVPKESFPAFTLVGHKRNVYAVAVSADGKRALSGGGSPGFEMVLFGARKLERDDTVRLWDLETGEEIRCFRGHTRAVRSVALSPDGRYGLSSSEDGTVRLWQLPRPR